MGQTGTGHGAEGNGTAKAAGQAKGKRQGFGGNRPLAHPDTHIHKLISRIQDYIYLPQPDPYYILLGTIIGNMMKGSPVWLVYIGPSSSGKTLKLEMMDALKPRKDKLTGKNLEPGVTIIGGMASTGALLSGVSRRETVKGSTGGLLREIGDRGTLIMKDFSTMLALNKDEMGKVIDALRQTFDGRYERPLGTDGGIRITWRGRVGFIAASTPAIDQHSKAIGDLGERWLYYRYNKSDYYGETLKALSVTDPEAAMGEMQALVSQYFERIKVEWDEPRRELTQQESMRIYAMAAFLCTARSGVQRNPYQHYEICELPSTEGPPRMALELGQLYLGLERGGIADEKERWKLVGRVAWDSIRQTRARVIDIVQERGVVSVAGVMAVTPLGKKTVEIVLEDLQVHGVLEYVEGREDKSGEKIAKGWRQTRWCKEHVKMGWGAEKQAEGKREGQVEVEAEA